MAWRHRPGIALADLRSRIERWPASPKPPAASRLHVIGFSLTEALALRPRAPSSSSMIRARWSHHVAPSRIIDRPGPLVPSGAELIIGAICFIVVFGILARCCCEGAADAGAAHRADRGRPGQVRGGQAEAKELLDQYREQLQEPGTRPPGCARRPGSRARRSSPRCGSRLRPRHAGSPSPPRPDPATAAGAGLAAHRGRRAGDRAGQPHRGESLADEARQSRMVTVPRRA